MLIVIIIISFVAVSLVLFYGSSSIAHSFYLRSVCRNREAKQSVALTFDDGVDEEMTPRVLDVLAKYNVKATFFVIGEKAKKHPNIVRRIIDEGHEVGNHSMYHRGTFPLGSTNAILREIEECSAVLESMTGKKVEYFRPPFGVTNPMIGRAVKRSHLQSIGWSIRSFDTIGEERMVVEKRVLDQIGGGDIVLLHDDRDGADVLLERLIIQLVERNYNLVSVRELCSKA